MKSGTGAKQRVIQATDVNALEPFAFNRSINPHGGTLARMRIRTNKKGRGIVRIYQDTNSDDKATRKELIFRGEGRAIYDKDELINFTGSVRLKKTMNMCDWLSMKSPGEELICPAIYIPTVYELTLFANSGEVYEFGGTGEFEDHIFK